MEAVVLFDGTCNLCNSTVQFIIKRDKAAVFKFASLQSAYASKLISLPSNAIPSTIILFKDGKKFEKSSAVLHIAKELNGLWPLLYGFMIVPKIIRDKIYGWIAKNRHKWFGKPQDCWVPTLALKNRFLDA